jgi:hypothetical protein
MLTQEIIQNQKSPNTQQLIYGGDILSLDSTLLSWTLPPLPASLTFLALPFLSSLAPFPLPTQRNFQIPPHHLFVIPIEESPKKKKKKQTSGDGERGDELCRL